MSTPAFELPETREAAEPPEARGHARDEVRLMVATRSDARIAHRQFRALPELLRPGDLLVVNVSGTLPAAVSAARADGSRLRVHFSTRAPRLDERWRVVELRSADGTRPGRGHAGERIALAGGATLELVAPYASGARLMLARFHSGDAATTAAAAAATTTVEDYLQYHGAPIRYGYVWGGWPLDAYQTVYATTQRVGWTNLVVTPERGLRVVDGLITGWHEPEASHLRLLEAATGGRLLERCYRAAIDHGYLWHEFGDSHPILP